MSNTKEKEIVYNTKGDILDITTHHILQNDGTVTKASEKDEIITSLDSLLLKIEFVEETAEDEVEIYYGLKPIEKQDYKLSRYLDKLPHGILDKKITGIGATTLEIKSKRNSIIVMPTRVLAFNKSQSHEETLYIGSSLDKSDKGLRLEERVDNYIEEREDKFKKFLVVADSLENLLGYLQEVLNIKVFNDYFLMVDEIDLMQSESHYRPRLEKIMDYYFKFNVKKRCLVSATIEFFSNPLLEKECRFDISSIMVPPRNINLLHTNNINQTTANEILKHPEEKILIAYNTITQIKNVISLLPEDLQKECSILCSEASTKEATPYYATLIKDKDSYTLPARINFMTSTYFVGIDINDKYHLITISNTVKSFQLLTENKIVQIYGRCRIENGILSDTIIYNTYKEKGIENSHNYTKSYNYMKWLIYQSEKIVELYKSADYISNKDDDLESLFSIVKNAIKDKATAVPFTGGIPIQITRLDIKWKYVPAYLNIDFLVERYNLRKLYSKPELLAESLKKAGHNIGLEFIDIDCDEEQENLEINNREEQEVLYDKDLEKIITQIKNFKQTFTTEEFNNYLQEKVKYNKGKVKLFFERYSELYQYVDSDFLLNYLYEIRNKNIKAYKTFKNSVMFWALSKDHPLRLDIKKTFKLNKEYTPEEIQEKLIPIVKYHFHKTLKPRAYISLFKTFYETVRPRNSYIPTRENPLKIEIKMALIPKNENNLLKYFVL